MTLAKIIETLKMIALKHPNINSAYEGNIYDILNAKPDNKYASVVITQQSHTADEIYDHYGFVIFYVDRLVDDMEENRIQIQSIGKSMLGNILTFFSNEFDAECNNITYQPFTQRFADETAGVYCTITIDMIKDVYCAEEYWDEDWAAPVTVIRNQDKKVVFTENGTYTIDYDPQTYTGLGTVEVDVNVDVESYFEDGYNLAKKEIIENAQDITITENGQYGDGEIIYKTIDVNVVPKIRMADFNLKFAYSNITTVPEWADFEGVTDMMNMFQNCMNLTEIPQIDTSNVTNMMNMFQNCFSLISIPWMDTSNVTNMDSMFDSCSNITSIPPLNAQQLTMYEWSGLFGYMDLNNLTDFGGLINLKTSLANEYTFVKTPNLSYQSCINILNGLFDFVGNGETPNSNQGQLKVHPNFLTIVGDEISIGTNKGWTITA